MCIDFYGYSCTFEHCQHFFLRAIGRTLSVGYYTDRNASLFVLYNRVCNISIGKAVNCNIKIGLS